MFLNLINECKQTEGSRAERLVTGSTFSFMCDFPGCSPTAVQAGGSVQLVPRASQIF